MTLIYVLLQTVVDVLLLPVNDMILALVEDQVGMWLVHDVQLLVMEINTVSSVIKMKL